MQDKLWVEFEGSGNSDKELLAKATALSSVLIYSSGLATESIIKSIGGEKCEDVNTGEKIIFLEFLFFLIHLTDRVSFNELDNDKRAIFIDNLVMVLRESLAETVEDVTERAALRDRFPKAYNERQVEYGKFKELFPDKDEDLKGTVFGEFGKAMASICGCEDDIRFLMYVITMAGEGFSNLQLTALFKGYSGTS